MEIEMPPHLGFKTLNPTIEGCRDTHQEHQSHRIRRVDVVEMNYLAVAVEHLAHQISHRNNYDYYQEDEQMHIAEGHDELRNRVVWHYPTQQFRFPYPSKVIIFRGKLHPHRVDAILRNHPDIRNHQQMVLLHGKCIHLQAADILLRLLAHQLKGILEHQEIILVGIMMGSRERDGVELSVAILHHRSMLLMRVMAMVAAAEHQ